MCQLALCKGRPQMGDSGCVTCLLGRPSVVATDPLLSSHGTFCSQTRFLATLWICNYAGMGNGARVAAIVGGRSRASLAGYIMLSYPVEVHAPSIAVQSMRQYGPAQSFLLPGACSSSTCQMKYWYGNATAGVDGANRQKKGCRANRGTKNISKKTLPNCFQSHLSALQDDTKHFIWHFTWALSRPTFP